MQKDEIVKTYFKDNASQALKFHIVFNFYSYVFFKFRNIFFFFLSLISYCKLDLVWLKNKKKKQKIGGAQKLQNSVQTT